MRATIKKRVLVKFATLASCVVLLTMSSIASANPAVGEFAQSGSGSATLLASGEPSCSFSGPATISEGTLSGSTAAAVLTFLFIAGTINGSVQINTNLNDGTVTGGTVQLTTGGETDSTSIDAAGYIYKDSPDSNIAKVEGLQFFFSPFAASDCFYQFTFINLVLLQVVQSSAGIVVPGTTFLISNLLRMSTQLWSGNVRRALRGRWFVTPLGTYQETPFGPSPLFFSDAAGTGVTPIQGGAMIHGKSAGEGEAMPWGLWASGTSSFFEDDFASTAFDADAWAVNLGADFSPRKNWVFGVAWGYEETDIDTSFNSGGTDVSSWSIVPYMGAILSEASEGAFELSFDMAGGYTNVDIDQFRRQGTASPVTSSTGSDRVFFSTNLTATRQVGNFYLSGTAGLLLARDKTDGFTESDGTVIGDQTSRLGQLSFGTEVMYVHDAWMPFVSLIYDREFNNEDLVTATAPQPANDDDQFRLNLGLRAILTERWSGTFEYGTTLGREDFNSDTFSLQVRGQF
jgi:hypothetical protein